MRVEHLVFGLAAVAVTAHIADHLVVGVESSLQFDAVVAFCAVTLAAVALYPRFPVMVQAIGLVVLGLSWLIGDLFHHVLPMLQRGAETTDPTGLGAAIGGAVMVGVGLAAGRRWRAAFATAVF